MKKKFVFAVLLIFLSCTKSKLDLSEANLPSLPKVVEKEIVKCAQTPTESIGSYPTKSPEKLIRTNIAESKQGVKLTIDLSIEYQGQVLENATVDLWHCDSQGNYSQYGTFEKENFLRGRQPTNTEGKVAFNSVFPGNTKDRVAHIYVKITTEKLTKITQIAFPQELQDKVYKVSPYKTTTLTNENDRVFSDSLHCNLPNEISGDIKQGLKIVKKISI